MKNFKNTKRQLNNFINKFGKYMEDLGVLSGRNRNIFQREMRHGRQNWHRKSSQSKKLLKKIKINPGELSVDC